MNFLNWILIWGFLFISYTNVDAQKKRNVPAVPSSRSTSSSSLDALNNQRQINKNIQKSLGKDDENEKRNRTLADRVLEFREELFDNDNLTDVLSNFQNQEVVQLILKFLPSSPKAVERNLEEEANRAFVAYTNARYSHCFNVRTTIPSMLYPQATACAAKHLYDGLAQFNQTLSHLINVPHFLNDTIDRLRECKKMNIGDPSQLNFIRTQVRVRRNVIDRSNKYFQAGVHALGKGLKAAGRAFLRYSRIVGRYTGHKLQVVRNYMRKKYQAMYKKVRANARPIMEKFKKIGRKTVKVAKVTSEFIMKYYCYYEVIDGLVGNVTTLVEDFIDRHSVLEQTKESVRLCVSQALDAESTKLCTGRGQVPELSDFDEVEEYDDWDVMNFEFDSNFE